MSRVTVRGGAPWQRCRFWVDDGLTAAGSALVRGNWTRREDWRGDDMGMRLGVRQSEVYDSGSLHVPAISELGELWRYRFLVWNFVSRDLKVRYKRSVFGFVWVMLNPLLTMAVLTIVFSYIFRFNTPHYAAYLLSGLIMWNLYSQGSTAAMASIQTGGHVLRKLYVPPSAFVASAIGSALVNFFFALAPFFALSIVDGVRLTWTCVFMVVPVLLMTMFTAGIGLIVAALIAFFNDTYEIYQVVLQAYYFIVPIFYPVETLSGKLRSLEKFNPPFLFMDMFRTVTINGQMFRLHEALAATLMALVVLLVGWICFTRVEDKFAYQF